MDHIDYMRRALNLALEADGCTSPNPMVGAVLVKDGRIIGEGFHRKAGGPHAEIEAIRAATEPVEGATAYVSLEPCCHYGKTPPCAKALIEAKVAEVHYAVPDDNPRVAGGGHRLLEEAGIRVFCGPLEAEGRFLNRAFFRYMTEKRSYVTAKYAMSLDGRIATRSGDSKWITGPEAREQAHWLRHRSDAILVGSGTAAADNPRLTTRLPIDNPAHPLRIVTDSTGRLSPDLHLFDPDLPGKTLLATTENCNPKFRKILEDRGIEAAVLPAGRNGGVSMLALTRDLAARGIVRLMVEGGAEVFGALFAENLVDETWTFIGAKLIGGHDAPGPFGGKGAESMAQVSDFKIYETSNHGTDVLIKAVRQTS